MRATTAIRGTGLGAVRHRGAALAALAALVLVLLASAPLVIAAGPPFPIPEAGRRVYDTAGVLSPAAIARTETRIRGIEAATGAQLVVYSQLVPDGTPPDEAESQAQALMDQWGVGRRGFDDGLVVLLDIYAGNTCHGQVQLYAGPGYRATYLSNDERLAIYEDAMLPLLRGCDMSGALDAAMDRIAEATTPQHAAQLQAARQANAVLGLVVAPLVLVLLVGGSLLRWRQAGRDPVYLDDPSILLPSPPPGLTPAAGAAVRDGRATRRSLTAASLDLAVRGLVAFRAKPPGPFSDTPGISIYTGQLTTGDPAEQARAARARARPIDEATRYLGARMERASGASAYLPPDRIAELADAVGEFNRRLERHVVAQGWFRSAPSGVTTRWIVGAVLVLALGCAPFFLGLGLPSSGLVLLGLALMVSGVAIGVVGCFMPVRTQAGAVVRAMLEAYRRTLARTMAMARSMDQVAADAAIPLVESPDDAVAWGVALGLNAEVEAVLQRSAEDRGGGRDAYLPAWYLPAALGSPGGGSGGASGGLAPGLMSSSPIPDFGSMMAALGTIGTPSASSGGGGGGYGGGGSGGFGGGGSGGGGGGAGGGF